jgi:hypothetical protein
MGSTGSNQLLHQDLRSAPFILAARHPRRANHLAEVTILCAHAERWPARGTLQTSVPAAKLVKLPAASLFTIAFAKPVLGPDLAPLPSRLSTPCSRPVSRRASSCCGHSWSGRVALCGLMPRLFARLMPALSSAVAGTAIAAAAQDDLDATACAQVQAGGLVHAQPGTTEVLEGPVPARHTAVAPPTSARCRPRYGRQASRRERPCRARLLRHRPRCTAGCLQRRRSTTTASVPESPPHCQAHRARACLAALQGGRAGAHPDQSQARPAGAVRLNRPCRKTATSPANRGGSWPAFTLQLTA